MDMYMDKQLQEYLVDISPFAIYNLCPILLLDIWLTDVLVAVDRYVFESHP